MRVAVLGCGPAGLIAAYAAETAGHTVTIYSRRRSSKMFGAMYLHEPIPNLCPDKPELSILVKKIGTREGYANNVYGDPKAPVSWDKFEEGLTPGWNMTHLYVKLWARYGARIIDTDLYPRFVHEVSDDYDKTFSTVPIRMLCENWQHSFEDVPIWVLHGKAKQKLNDLMVYNGLAHEPLTIPSWYRYSVINGYHSYEFAVKRAPQYLEAQRVTEGLQVSGGVKPLGTDCDCYPGIIRLGRFGKWDKNAFTHHSYREVRDALQHM
jgi:hypothetical protein